MTKKEESSLKCPDCGYDLKMRKVTDDFIPKSRIEQRIKELEALQPKDRDLWNTVNDYRADMIYTLKDLLKQENQYTQVSE